MIYVHDDSIMSYLIALYVWYHGNNLLLFGIDKTVIMAGETPKNEGLKTPDEINPALVDKELIDAVKEQQRKERRNDNWEKILREAISESQVESYKVSQAGLVENTLFNNSSDTAVELYGDNTGGFDRSLFRDLNGINTKRDEYKYDDPFEVLNNSDPWSIR